MKGQDTIIAMRRAGYAPAYVWIQTKDGEPEDDMTVCVQSSDVPELQDWRFVFGLTALVEGENVARVERIARACKGIAKRVISSVAAEKKDAWGRSTFRVIAIKDTEGHLTWQQ